MTTVSLLSGICISSTQAATINTSGTWSNATGTTVTGLGTSQISWGTSTGEGQSSYEFAGIMGEVITLPTSGGSSSMFALGDFTHENFPIGSGTSIEGATLNINFDLIDGSTTINQMFSFDFSHNETPNSQPPAGPGCTTPPGSVEPCPDVVSFLNNGEFSQTINIDGEEFSLFIEG